MQSPRVGYLPRKNSEWVSLELDEEIASLVLFYC